MADRRGSGDTAESTPPPSAARLSARWWRFHCPAARFRLPAVEGSPAKSKPPPARQTSPDSARSTARWRSPESRPRQPASARMFPPARNCRWTRWPPKAAPPATPGIPPARPPPACPRNPAARFSTAAAATPPASPSGCRPAPWQWQIRLFVTSKPLMARVPLAVDVPPVSAAWTLTVPLFDASGMNMSQL